MNAEPSLLAGNVVICSAIVVHKASKKVEKERTLAAKKAAVQAAAKARSSNLDIG